MESIHSTFNTRSVLFFIFLVAIFIGLIGVSFPVNPIINEAEAIVGRPATPGSVAGTARRTTRRVVRRVAIGTRVTVLPSGCITTIEYGVKYYHCGGVYYRAYYEGTTVVYVIVEEP
jgi:hypothetical protein